MLIETCGYLLEHPYFEGFWILGYLHLLSSLPIKFPSIFCLNFHCFMFHRALSKIPRLETGAITWLSTPCHPKGRAASFSPPKNQTLLRRLRCAACSLPIAWIHWVVQPSSELFWLWSFKRCPQDLFKKLWSMIPKGFISEDTSHWSSDFLQSLILSCWNA